MHFGKLKAFKIIPTSGHMLYDLLFQIISDTKFISICQSICLFSKFKNLNFLPECLSLITPLPGKTKKLWTNLSCDLITIPLCSHGQVSHHFQSATGDVLPCMIRKVLFEILKNCKPKLLFCRRSCSVRNFDHKNYEKEAILVHIVPIYAQSYLKIWCRLKLWLYFTASTLQ